LTIKASGKDKRRLVKKKREKGQPEKRLKLGKRMGTGERNKTSGKTGGEKIRDTKSKGVPKPVFRGDYRKQKKH